MKEKYQEALALLKQLIEIPSVSREEGPVCDFLAAWFKERGLECSRKHHNLWLKNRHFDAGKPTLLLNSHLDTVKPAASWSADPFTPRMEGSRLVGLGSNDAGASVVSLISAFMHFYEADHTDFNTILALTAEEEISGKKGIVAVLPELGKVDLAIVGEPTSMQMAIAEKGLMVIDATAAGIAGHAARDEGKNAIYEALEDIRWIQSYQFPKASEYLGEVRMTVTQIHAGTQHNVVPDACRFVVDVRTNEHYSNREAFGIINEHTRSDLQARSLRLNSSGIATGHPVVRLAGELGIICYGSPTTSDQALMPFASVKMGPGESARSHTAGEYITTGEIEQGISTYIRLLENLTFHL